MQIGFSKIVFPKQGALVLGVLEDSKMLAKTQEADRDSGGMITAAIKNSNFSGKSHQVLSVFTPERRIVLYGLGKGDNIDELWSEEAGGRIFSSLEKSGEKTVTVIFENHSRTKKILISAQLILLMVLSLNRTNLISTGRRKNLVKIQR